VSAPALYLITDRTASPCDLVERVESALAAVDPRRVAVQLREKDLDTLELLALARRLVEVCARRGVPLLVNDRADVALAAGAAGVHLGGHSMPARAARALLGPSALIGVSCHGPAEVRARAPGANFATYGPVFETPSKRSQGPPIGLADLQEALAVGVPVVALGGISADTARGLRAKGFHGIACIRAVFSTQDPGEAATRLLASFDEGARGSL
jgi:thiamine-phosphate pyrophosphorylase